MTDHAEAAGVVLHACNLARVNPVVGERNLDLYVLAGIHREEAQARHTRTLAARVEQSVAAWLNTMLPDDAAWDRMSAAGAQLMTWFGLACELHRDWRNDIEGLAALQEVEQRKVTQSEVSPR